MTDEPHNDTGTDIVGRRVGDAADPAAGDAADAGVGDVADPGVGDAAEARVEEDATVVGADTGVDAPTPSLRHRISEVVTVARRSLTLPDVAAVAVLTAATLHLVARDGGRHPRESLAALVVVALGALILLPGLRRRSGPLVGLLAAWAVAPLIAVAAAEIRSGMVRPLVVAAFVPAVALATIHLWRRPWGPRVIGTILVLAALRAWYGAFLVWWGTSGGRPTWMALSWHNQSGTLMGAFGVGAAALGVASRGRSRAALLSLGSACLAGAWLSGSRGAVVATVIGLVVVAVGIARSRLPWREIALASGALAVLTVGTVTALEAMVGSDASQPLIGRDQSASQNLTARFGHWEAAARMAASRPVTGWGPGSYRWASLDHYPTDTNLTSSAHNEYLEVLGGSGVVGAAPVWFGALAIGWLALAAAWRRRPDDLGGGPRAGVTAAAGVASVLGLHAAIDFDWDYPVLLVLLTIAGAVLWASRPRMVALPPGTPGVAATSPAAGTTSAVPTGPSRALTVIAAIAVVAGLGAGITAAAIRPASTPWDLDGRLSAAVTASAQGDLAGARAALDQARTWNPGSTSLPVVAAVVDHRAGEIDDADLAGMVGPEHASSSDHLLVARRLLEADATDQAGTVVDGLAPMLEGRRRWGGKDPATAVAGLQLAVAARDGGCDSAEALADQVVAWAATFDAEPARIGAAFAAASPEADCALPQLRGD